MSDDDKPAEDNDPIRGFLRPWLALPLGLLIAGTYALTLPADISKPISDAAMHSIAWIFQSPIRALILTAAVAPAIAGVFGRVFVFRRDIDDGARRPPRIGLVNVSVADLSDLIVRDHGDEMARQKPEVAEEKLFDPNFPTPEPDIKLE